LKREMELSPFRVSYSLAGENLDATQSFYH
jgi:hypothetical protein